MALILNIETATKNCSVALGVDGKAVALKEESSSQYIHAEKLHEFIREVLEENEITAQDLDAVSVSQGPGSYTGLRIGMSAAKGLCFALGLPLIAIDTTAVLARSAEVKSGAVIIAAIDARRNEAYVQAFDEYYNALDDIIALEIQEESFAEWRDKNLVIVGDAAEKMADLLKRNVEAFQQFPSATDLATVSEEAFLQKDFKDVAYHEPFYLKDFIAGKPKKML